MNNKLMVAFGLMALLGSFQANALSNDKEFMAFFSRYDALNKAYDPAVADLYAEDAKIYGTTISPDGTESRMMLTGKKLKAMMGDAMEYAKKMGEMDQYSHFKIATSGDTTKISADRYSLSKCLTDHSYYMIVKKKADGSLQIIEEANEIPYESQCKDGVKEDIALQLSLAAKMTNANLPVKVDGDTLFERTSAEGNELTQYYKMINFKAEEIDKIAFKQAIEPLVKSNVCLSQQAKKLLDKGAVLNQQYFSQDDQLLVRIRMDADTCKPAQ